MTRHFAGPAACGSRAMKTTRVGDGGHPDYVVLDGILPGLSILPVLGEVGGAAAGWGATSSDLWHYNCENGRQSALRPASRRSTAVRRTLRPAAPCEAQFSIHS